MFNDQLEDIAAKKGVALSLLNQSFSDEICGWFRDTRNGAESARKLMGRGFCREFAVPAMLVQLRFDDVTHADANTK